MDASSEWRTAGADQSRGTENLLLLGPDITTVISPVAPFHSFGVPKHQNKRTFSAQDQALIDAFREIDSMAERIQLPRSIVNKAKNLFIQVHDSKNLKKKANDAVASAALYIACRQEGATRILKEICAVSKRTRKEIERCFKLIKKMHPNIDLITNNDIMTRFCATLGLPNVVHRAAAHIAAKAMSLEKVSEHSPISITAAAIYMASQASDDKRTLKEIGTITGVANTTIRSLYVLMSPHAVKLFPEYFKYSAPIEKLPQR